MLYIKPTAIKKLVKSLGKRCSKIYLEALDRSVEKQVKDSCAIWGRKTI